MKVDSKYKKINCHILTLQLIDILLPKSPKTACWFNTLFLCKASFFPNMPLSTTWRDDDIVEVEECRVDLNFSRLLLSSPKSLITSKLDDTLGAATSK